MKVSLILPAYNNPRHVNMALKMFALQDVNFNDMEILVVDDGSEVPLEQSITERYGLPLRIIRKPHGGRAHTRNWGIAEANGDILLFADSDLLPVKEFVRYHLQAHKETQESIILGRVDHISAAFMQEVERLVADGVQFDKLSALIEKEQYVDLAKTVFADAQMRRFIPWVCCLFSNCSVKREVLEKVGVFDEEYNGWGLEDIDLGYRFYLAGFQFGYHSEIVNYHVDHAGNPSTMLRDMSRNLVRFRRKHNSEAVGNYCSFVAGFLSLSELLEKTYHVQPESPAGANLFFKPISYAKFKS